MMKWNNAATGDIFEVKLIGRELRGIFNNNSSLISKLEYGTEMEADETMIMPKNIWAQVGYMTTNPTRNGLGYMMSFAGANEAINNKVDQIFVSSGSIKGGGKTLIERLGGKYNSNCKFSIKGGGEMMCPGYLIDTLIMHKYSAAGWKAKSWNLNYE